jgi:YD repeat-containing protein
MKSIVRNSIFLMIALAAMHIFTVGISAQPNGYVFTYDGSGNRLSRTFTQIILKSADTTMTETTVGNFNIKIYPNPTKGQLTLNISNLGKDDEVVISRPKSS